MPTLREIRRRITGVRNTQKITKAMKMVAAAKLRRAQDSIISARPYAKKMKELLKLLSANLTGNENPFFVGRELKNVALIIVTADRGLCGGFNSNIIRMAVQHINANYSDLTKSGNVHLINVGKKGYDFFNKRNHKIDSKHIGIFHDLNFQHAKNIIQEITRAYLSGKYDKVEIIYNEFKSVVQQKIVIDKILPIPSVEIEQSTQNEDSASIDYIYEPSSREIIDALTPKYLNFQIWKILLESNAAEQGARMTAMENATTNANEMMQNLQLSYNKARQASITKELLEIVSGAEALKKSG